jgi:hypothetical protein
MTDWAMQNTSRDSRILSSRLGAFLKRQGSAKQLSRLLDCDLRTMNNIRGGQTWPIERHWLNIWFEFGEDVVEAVFYPERVDARLAREAEAREAARRQRIASASAVVEGRAFSMGQGLGEGPGPDEEPAELGPPNLDLFDEAQP